MKKDAGQRKSWMKLRRDLLMAAETIRVKILSMLRVRRTIRPIPRPSSFPFHFAGYAAANAMNTEYIDAPVHSAVMPRGIPLIKKVSAAEKEASFPNSRRNAFEIPRKTKIMAS